MSHPEQPEHHPGPPGSPPPPPGADSPYDAPGSDAPRYDAPGHGAAVEASPDAGKRPGTVLAGCVLAWVGATVGVLSGLFFISVDENSQIFDDLAGGMSRSEAADVMQVTGILTLVWCLVVAVVAIFAFRAARWAGIALLVMAGLVGMLTVYNLLAAGGGSGVVGFAWSAASAYLVYLHPRSKEWFAAHR